MLPPEAFSKLNARRTHKGEPGRQSRCKVCIRARTFGITWQEVEELLGRCREVCGSCENLRIDHDRDSGEVRGTLCHMCNVAYGMLKDSPALVARLAGYAERTCVAC